MKQNEWTCAFRGRKYSESERLWIIETATKGPLLSASEVTHAFHLQNVIQIEIKKKFEEDGPNMNLFTTVRVSGVKNFLRDQPLKYDMKLIL